jgi:hypothetical protein
MWSPVDKLVPALIGYKFTVFLRDDEKLAFLTVREHEYG